MLDTPRTTLALLVRKRRFFFQKLVLGYAIGETPHFDEPGLTFFRRRMHETRVYLEYGSGASTLVAASHVPMVISVECDRVFAKAVKEHVTASAHENDVRIIYANIGVTEEWGYPLFHSTSARRLEAWRNYAEAPWRVLTPLHITPDTILIDGRFRVACALRCFLSVDRSCCVLVDDYGDRDYYKEIERHSDIVAMHGRMAEFRKKPDFDEGQCRDDLARYSRIPD